MMNQEITLQADDLSCVRHDKMLFHPLSFTLLPSDILLVAGENGSGKSSLLRLLSGLVSVTQGKVSWGGECIQMLGAAYWQKLHYIGHSNGLKLGLTVNENLQLANYLATYTPINIEHADAILEQLALSAYKNTLARYLSAGQKRRLALAKLFLLPKPLWILDEPQTALDTQTQALFLAQLKEHIAQGGIAVISSHHSLHEAQQTLKTILKTIRLILC